MKPCQLGKRKEGSPIRAYDLAFRKKKTTNRPGGVPGQGAGRSGEVREKLRKRSGH